MKPTVQSIRLTVISKEHSTSRGENYEGGKSIGRQMQSDCHRQPKRRRWENNHCSQSRCRIFETTKYSNVLFVGYDVDGNPKYGAVRATTGSFKGDVQGSDKKCAFKIVRAESPRKVHVFESVPDLLSYATLVKLSGKNWLKETYLSLAGIGGKVVPMALEQFLKDYPDS